MPSIGGNFSYSGRLYLPFFWGKRAPPRKKGRSGSKSPFPSRRKEKKGSRIAKGAVLSSKFSEPTLSFRKKKLMEGGKGKIFPILQGQKKKKKKKREERENKKKTKTKSEQHGGKEGGTHQGSCERSLISRTILPTTHPPPQGGAPPSRGKGAH